MKFTRKVSEFGGKYSNFVNCRIKHFIFNFIEKEIGEVFKQEYQLEPYNETKTKIKKSDDHADSLSLACNSLNNSFINKIPESPCFYDSPIIVKKSYSAPEPTGIIDALEIE